jgi:putative methionine-R-sulfoxide reductase with GAF domain
MNLLRSLTPLLLIAFPVIRLAGQDIHENNFTHYTTAEGLSHNNVTGIEQDSIGYIWISTLSGLNRYDGNRFVQFHSNNDSLSLAAEELGSMTWLDKYRLAIYTSGLHIVDTKTGAIRNLLIPYHDKRYQYKFNMVERALTDNEGNIYILSRSGFYHFDKNCGLVSRFDYYREKDVVTEHFSFGRDLFDIDKQYLLIVSIGGLYVYDKNRKETRKMQAADCPILSQFMNYPVNGGPLLYRFFQTKPGIFFILNLRSDSLVYVDVNKNIKTNSRLPFNPLHNEFHYRTRLIPASDTLLYLTGHFSGFFKMRFYPETGAVKFSSKKYFPSYLCNSLIQDRDGNLWVATNKGLLREDEGKSQVQQSFVPNSILDSFANMRIDDVYATDDKIYAGTRSHGGLLVFDKQTFRFEKTVVFERYRERVTQIYAIASAGKQGLLLGTGGHMVIFDPVSEKYDSIIPVKWTEPLDWVNDLYKARNNDIWVSSHILYRYRSATRKFELLGDELPLPSVPFAIREDTAGNIWMAAHGLARYNTKLDSFDLIVDSFPAIKMQDNQINSMVIDQQNRIWFNSYNNGLIAYDIAKKTFLHFTRNDGLPDNNIASMIVIGQRLWIASYSGLATMDLRTLQITCFGKEDGFPEMPIIKGAGFFYDSMHQQLYIGFTNAVTRFNPFDILRKKIPPHIFIENIVINGEKNIFLPSDRITTSWRKSDIMITIGSINFTDGYSQGFAYRILKNSHSPWQYIGDQSSFSISNLSPGTYIIQVKSYSLHNRWPEQVKEITIVVLPPFWKREWFIGIMAGIAIVMIYLLIRWRTGVARKKEMEKTHIQKLKADDYKNQFELEQISNYFSSSLAGKKTEDEVLWDVASNLIARMNYVDCMIYLWNEDKTKMIQKAAYGPKGTPEAIRNHVFDVVPGQGVVGYVMETREPLLISDTRKDPRYRMDEMARLSEICVPIIHNDELIGIIDSEHHELNYYKDRDLKTLTTIATLIGNKLKQIESEQSLEIKQKELVNINEQLIEARLAALQAQMNPHFVFNALNSIKRMILDHDNERASRYLSKFALMIRMTLNHSKDPFVTLDENIEYLQAYLEMEQLRFDDSFTYTIVMDKDIDEIETMIPSLMMQPLVENAIWHGLMTAPGDKKIIIGFTKDENKIICSIEDNGIGIEESEKLKLTTRPLHRSLGLENLQKRIRIMNEKYDLGCRLSITDLKHSGKRGTKVVLQFNVINV